MHCPSCATRYPDGLQGCSRCRLHFRWEYKESIVQLGEINSHTPDSQERFSEAIARHLAQLGQAGWQPAEEIDWTSLVAAGRIESTKESIGGGPPIERFHSARLRLRQLHVSPGPPVGAAANFDRSGAGPDDLAGQIRTG